MELEASQTYEQISILSNEIENLKNEIINFKYGFGSQVKK